MVKRVKQLGRQVTLIKLPESLIKHKEADEEVFHPEHQLDLEYTQLVHEYLDQHYDDYEDLSSYGDKD